MRGVLALVLCLALAGPAGATQTRAPRLLIVLCDAVAGFGYDLSAVVRPMLSAYGCQMDAVLPPGTTTPPPNAAGQWSIRFIGQKEYQKNNWGHTYAYDGVVILGADWKFVGLRVDSLTFAPTYPDVPVLVVGMRNGGVTAGHDSTGVTDGSATQTPAGAASLTGTPYQVGQATGNGETAMLVSASYGNGGVTKLVEGPTGGDTTLVWRRNLGNGGTITFVSVINQGGPSSYKNLVPNIIIGVTDFVAQLPDSVRPRPVFKIAYHIDDGFKRDAGTTSGGIQPAQYATMAQYVDSLQSRAIKYTLGVELSTDTLGHVASDAAADKEDAGVTAGQTRWAKDLATWDSQYCKLTPHCHSGVDPGTTANASTGGNFYDLCGGSRSRACDPTAALDTTLYWMNKLALDSLTARVGAAKVDHVVMPPTDDWAPLNLFTSPCTVTDMLGSYKRAGYRAIRFNPTPTVLPGANTNSDAGGYYSWPGLYPTAYGQIGLLAINFDGYLPGLSASSQTALTAAQRASYPSDTFMAYFIGRLASNQLAAGQAGMATAPSAVIVNHARNYGGSAPGWMVVRDVDSWMRAFNQAAGYTQWQWVWSEDLNPVPSWNP